MTKEQTRRLLLDPANPHDFTLEELEGFGDALRASLDDVVDVVPVLRDEQGYGGPLSEVIHVWLQVAESVEAFLFARQVARACGRLLQGRWQADQDRCENDEVPRKRVATIYGPDDRPLIEVEVDAPDGVPRESLIEPGPDPLPHPRPVTIEEHAK